MLLLTNSLRMSWNHKDFKAQLLKHRYQARKVSNHVFSVLHVPFLTRSTILLIEFGVVTTAWYLFAYHFMLQNINWKWPRLTPFVDKKKRLSSSDMNWYIENIIWLFRDVIRKEPYYIMFIIYLNMRKSFSVLWTFSLRDQYHFKGYDKGVMISISVTADKYRRNVLLVLYMQISFI